MPSSFSWLDLSDRERRKVLDAIDRFKERDTRDELGLGTIRDSFANRFFPGTSVVQTRVRYFLFVPWIYQQLDARRVSAGRIANEGRRAEIVLIQALLDAGEKEGVIGRMAKQSLQRLPSNVYWLGLRQWGICGFPGLQDEFHRQVERVREWAGSIARDDDGMALAHAPQAWHPGIPPAPANFPDGVTLALTPAEAGFLQQRIVETTHGSVLHVFARSWEDVECPFVWMHPRSTTLPSELQAVVTHARHFAMAMQGANLVYYLLLHEKRQRETGGSVDQVEEVRDRLQTWASELDTDPSFVRWDRRDFWPAVRAQVQVPISTGRFVDEWIESAPWARRDGGADCPRARILVDARERRLKGARSRLHSTRALELWGGFTQAARMDFRWRTARSFLRDIHAALQEGTDARAQ